MNSVFRRRAIARWLLAIAILSGFAPNAFATFIYVTTTDDQYNNGLSTCSLRAALHAASARVAFAGCAAGNGGDTIFIPAGTYAITLPPVAGHLEQGGAFYIGTQDGSVIALDGQGGAAATIVDAQGLDSVMNINPGDNSTTLVIGLTFRGGVSSTRCLGSGVNFDCFVNATNPILSVFDSWITGNVGGPAFFAEGGTINMSRVSITDNSATAIYMESTEGAATFDDITVSRNVNSIGDEPGGLFFYGPTGAITISNSTIAYNGFSDSNDNDFDANNAGGIAMAGTPSPTVYLRNTIVARNTRGDRSRGGDCAGSYQSQGYNLIGDSQNCFLGGLGTGNLVNVDPMLAPLFDYGHGLPTHLLMTGSPAIGAGNPALAGSGGTACAQFDGRNFDRTHAGGVCDIGAYQTHVDYNVTSTQDVNDSNPGDDFCGSANGCTLRAAIDEANAATTFKTIRLPAGRYSLGRGPTYFLPDNSSGSFFISSGFPVTIIGAGAGKTIIDGAGLDRTFLIFSFAAANPTVSFHDLTITGGANPYYTSCGGGVLIDGNFLLSRSTVVNNSASCGGGVEIESAANAVIDSSTIAGNRTVDPQSGYGGGVYASSNSNVAITNSTIARNTSAQYGGGIGVSSGAIVSLAFDTIVDNVTSSGGGGIARYNSGTFFARASIIANNTDASGQAPDCDASLQVEDWIILRSDTGCAIGGSESTLVIKNQDPRLTSITLQGGPTPTVGLTTNSPAFDYLQGEYQCADLHGVQVLDDQRAVPRPTDHYGLPQYGGYCDIGAFQGTSDVIFASNIDY